MRKYLQLAVVLLTFFSAVFVRHLRDPERRQVLGQVPTDTGQPPVTPSSTLQPTATLPPAAPTTPAGTVLPTPVVTVATVVALTPTLVPTAPVPAPSAVPEATRTPTPTARKWPTLFVGSLFRDGEFTGKPSRTTYGDLQLRVAMLGGQIQSIAVVQYPNRTPTSVRMSGEVIPTLVARALAVQDWDVDVITGATQTSQAFQRAMVYALRESEHPQAKADGL